MTEDGGRVGISGEAVFGEGNALLGELVRKRTSPSPVIDMTTGSAHCNAGERYHASASNQRRMQLWDSRDAQEPTQARQATGGARCATMSFWGLM